MYNNLTKLYSYLSLYKIEEINHSNEFENIEKDIISYLYLKKEKIKDIIKMINFIDQKKDLENVLKEKDFNLLSNIQAKMEELRKFCKEFLCTEYLDDLKKNIQKIDNPEKELNFVVSLKNEDYKNFKEGTLLERGKLKKELEKLIKEFNENKKQLENIRKEIKEDKENLEKTEIIQILEKYNKYITSLQKKIQTS